MPVQWRKSSYSGTANDDVCVELGRLEQGGGVGVRDFKDPGRGYLALTVSGFAVLLGRLKQR
ncbi:DUF397 domain-containing protein [Actinomadura sp. BRA 177]|uniref:DUF397 domain-containing protein n=1 Tax=Actinomadura sp. BRA 177 TaxID=2745202 RepID=UPI0015950FE5|nr:DUF397 domain-containing protein [Actinomadura sp. BRA 177]NVI91847.1 DUF397 domain-containing protein [Actinomadura sp. BRA 177]